MNCYDIDVNNLFNCCFASVYIRINTLFTC